MVLDYVRKKLEGNRSRNQLDEDLKGLRDFVKSL
jgi:hypothetical protein